jgi:hypothetical protein
MEKFKPTEYYIVYDFETMEELIDIRRKILQLNWKTTPPLQVPLPV